MLVDVAHRLCLDSNVTTPLQVPNKDQVVGIWGSKGLDIWRGVETFAKERPDTNWYPFVNNLVPMKMFKSVFDSIYSDLKPTRLHIANRTSRKTKIHLQWYEEEELNEWLHNKRDQQVEWLIAATADLMATGGSPQPPNSTLLGTVLPSIHRQAARDLIREVLADKTLPRQVTPIPIDPFIRPQLTRFTGIEIVEPEHGPHEITVDNRPLYPAFPNDLRSELSDPSHFTTPAPPDVTTVNAAAARVNALMPLRPRGIPRFKRPISTS